ncbi:hypothetical protein [Paenibacillus sp. MBLB4367]|uniref:hypothetical protein n=1 Tax=Paenibacillus sp. MBLB4367 TaxID=3384767 RepID=UPI0039082077
MTAKTLYSIEAEPCRNFCILGTTAFIDPVDNREKLVLSNFSAGSVGNLVLIDKATGEGESIPLPGDSGAWALLAVGDHLLVGTCPDYGYLHSLNLITRRWAEPLRIESETYIWNFALGTDGMVYAGTYPGCLLLRYDPAAHTLTSLGRVSDNLDNYYSRNVFAIPNRMLINVGFNKRFVSVWSMADGSYTRLGEDGEAVIEADENRICTEFEGTQRFYNSRTLELIAPSTATGTALLKLKQAEMTVLDGKRIKAVRFTGGGLAGVKGQDYFIQYAEGQEPVCRPIPTPAPPTRIHTLTSDSNGVVWGSSGFGQTIFRYDPRDGSYWNSAAVCENGGEVYGMAFVGKELFMAAYSGGDHVVYRPDEPWNQYGNINPKTLQAVGPGLIRPLGKTVIGPDGAVWTGWSAAYGVYGGGISRVDPVTKEVFSWLDPVPGQQVCGLAGDGRYLYLTTNGGGNGLTYKEEEDCCFTVWDPVSASVVFLHRFEPGRKTGVVLFAHGFAWMRAGNEIAAFDPARMAFAAFVPLDEACGCLVKYNHSSVLAFGETSLFRIHAGSMQAARLGDIPPHVTTATVTPDGAIYFNQYGTRLYRLDMDDLASLTAASADAAEESRKE